MNGHIDSTGSVNEGHTSEQVGLLIAYYLLTSLCIPSSTRMYSIKLLKPKPRPKTDLPVF